VFDFLYRSHLPDRALILFRAGLLDRSCSDLLEAHLLLCPTCQLQLEDTLPSTGPRSAARHGNEASVVRPKLEGASL
jgi:hypothetical protein